MYLTFSIFSFDVRELSRDKGVNSNCHSKLSIKIPVSFKREQSRT